MSAYHASSHVRLKVLLVSTFVQWDYPYRCSCLHRRTKQCRRKAIESADPHSFPMYRRSRIRRLNLYYLFLRRSLSIFDVISLFLAVPGNPMTERIACWSISSWGSFAPDDVASISACFISSSLELMKVYFQSYRSKVR